MLKPLTTRVWCLVMALMAVLVACPDPIPRVEYKLLSILPTPVTPGDTVTAFGVFPKTAQVFVGGELITSSAVKDGLRFTLPSTASAQDTNVRISGVAPWGENISLAGSLAVNPRIDAVAVQGQYVRVLGAGWTASSSVVLKVNGRAVPVSQDGAALLGELPRSATFGLLTVTVEVAKRVSNPKGVLFEAGAVQGRVNIPVAVAEIQARVSTVKATQVKAFLVKGTQAAQRAVRLLPYAATKAIRALDLTQFTFSSVALAQQAFRILRDAAIFAAWDQWVGVTDAGLSTISQAPKSIRTTLAGSVPTPSSEQWFLGLQSIPMAWQVTQGKNVTVAVIDTGVDLKHPDLKANVLPGYDFVDNDPIAQDISGHGTHVAGLVAANGKAYGVAPQANILPIRVLRDLSGGSTSTVAQGILWAANLLPDLPNLNPAQIINLSLGSNDYSPILDAAIQQVQTRGVIVVAAAGNSGGAVAFPAALKDVIAVTALAGVRGGDLLYQPSYASRGPGVWVTAFGGDMSQDQNKDGFPDGILSTDVTDTGYGLRMGTSMASPQVAGLAALALASGSKPAMVRELLAQTATDLGVRGIDLQFGYGLISSRAITGSQPRMYAIALDTTSKVVSWSLVQQDGTFLVQNLTPSQNLQIIIASDENANGIVGEIMEWRSDTLEIQAVAAQIKDVETLSLHPSNQSGVQLIVKP